MGRLLAALWLGLLMAGCASTSTDTSTASSAPRTPRPSSELITQAQLRAQFYPNLYEAVRSLHSGWLRARGADSFRSSSMVQVYRDDMRVGGVESLRSMNPRDIGYVRYYDGNSATARWGLGHGSGVIFVSTRPL